MGRAGRFVEWVIINDHKSHVRTWLPLTHSQDHPPVGSFAGQMPPRYSTDIATAWKVVEQLTPEFTIRRVSWAIRDRGDGITYMQEHGYHNGWWAVATEEGGLYSFAETAPLAICLAALATAVPR